MPTTPVIRPMRLAGRPPECRRAPRSPRNSLHHALPRLSCSFAGLDQRHLDTALANDIAMPRPWCGADDGDALDIGVLFPRARRRLGGFRSERRRSGCAFDWSLDNQLEKTLAFLLQTFIERQIDGAPRGVAAANGLPAHALSWVQRRDRVGEDRAVALAAASLMSSSRSLRNDAFSASTLRATPRAGRRPSTISSIRPFLSASVR